MQQSGLLEFSPAEFVAILNQTIEFAYPQVAVVGELSSFRVARGRWVYFDLVEKDAKVSFFGSVYSLPGPLEDGMVVRAIATPRLHPQFGFTLNFSSIQVAGEGSLKKAANLLMLKLEKEGLFDANRKRQLPSYPEVVALVSAKGSAAESDFKKVSLARWPSLEISHEDAIVQGAEAPESVLAAIARANQLVAAELIIITRGGGSAEDLAAFNDERVVRAIAGSRLPTVVAIGHEKDYSLAELAADVRASTPTDAAILVTVDVRNEAQVLEQVSSTLAGQIRAIAQSCIAELNHVAQNLTQQVGGLIESEMSQLLLQAQVVAGLDPEKPLRQGYALVTQSGKRLYSAKDAAVGGQLKIRLADGTINSKVEGIE